MDARTSSRQKRISAQQEKSVAGALDGRVSAASGATRFDGGSDVKAQNHVVECKYTEKKSYILKREDLQKIYSTAIRRGLVTPVMAIDFQDPVTHRPDRYAVLRWNDFLALLETNSDDA